MNETTTDTAAPAAFDLGSVVVSDVAEMAVNHPATGQPTTWKLQLAGPGHPATVALANDNARDRMALAQEQERARVNGRKWKGADVDPEAEREKNLRRAARRIVGWTPVTLNGAAFPYSAENAYQLLADPKHSWVADQFFRFLDEDAAFIDRSGKTS